MIIVSLPLDPTRTHRRRSLTWVVTQGHADGRLGTLTILQGASVESYAVHRLGHDYRLVKLGGGEVYDLRLGNEPQYDTCGCTAGQFRRAECKHRNAARALIAAAHWSAAMHSPWDELVELPGYDAWKTDNERAPDPPERDEDERHDREIAVDR